MSQARGSNTAPPTNGDWDGRAVRVAIGAVITQARGLAGLSQGELARRLEVRQSTVSQWERGSTIPTLLMFRQMVGALGPWPLLRALLPPGHTDPAILAAAIADRPVQPAASPQELEALIDQGLSDSQIGQRYGVHGAMVTGWRRALGVEPPWRLGPRPPRHELASLLGEGLSDHDLARRYQVSHWTVIGWRRTYHLFPRASPPPNSASAPA